MPTPRRSSKKTADSFNDIDPDVLARAYKHNEELDKAYQLRLSQERERRVRIDPEPIETPTDPRGAIAFLKRLPLILSRNRKDVSCLETVQRPLWAAFAILDPYEHVLIADDLERYQGFQQQAKRACDAYTLEKAWDEARVTLEKLEIRLSQADAAPMTISNFLIDKGFEQDAVSQSSNTFGHHIGRNHKSIKPAVPAPKMGKPNLYARADLETAYQDWKGRKPSDKSEKVGTK